MARTAELGFFEFDRQLVLSDTYEETAKTRCDHLIDLLSDEFSILDAFPTGSIPRRTAIRGLADLDIIVVLEDWEWRGEPPADVLQRVRDHLSHYKETQIRKNGQAVTMYYDSWPQVDVVPAGVEYKGFGVTDDYLVIPDMTSGRWLQSQPRTHSRALERQADRSGYPFLDIIRMLKWWNYKHGSLLQSFHIEAMALEFASIEMEEYSWEITQFFDQAIASVKEYASPGSLDEEYLTYETRPAVIKRLESAEKQASHAWYLAYDGRGRDEESIEIWRRLFPDRFPAYG